MDEERARGRVMGVNGKVPTIIVPVVIIIIHLCSFGMRHHSTGTLISRLKSVLYSVVIKQTGSYTWVSHSQRDTRVDNYSTPTYTVKPQKVGIGVWFSSSCAGCHSQQELCQLRLDGQVEFLRIPFGMAPTELLLPYSRCNGKNLKMKVPEDNRHLLLSSTDKGVALIINVPGNSARSSAVVVVLLIVTEISDPLGATWGEGATRNGLLGAVRSEIMYFSVIALR